MPEFKLVIGMKDGKSVQKMIKDPEAKEIMGAKIGDKVHGDKLGFHGYEFEISGGSDYCGFPMRKDLPGPARKKVMITKSIGMKDNTDGMRKRKTICGNVIHARISQINLKVLKEGKEKLVQEAKEGEVAETKPKKKAK
jgi:small subunit ribosomal protein S6e